MVVGYILRFSLFDLPLGSILLLLVLLVLVPFLLQHILRRKFVFFLLLLVSRFGQYTRYGSGWACDGRFRFLALRYQRLQLHSFNFCSKASKQIAARNDGNLCMKSSTLLRSPKEVGGSARFDGVSVPSILVLGAHQIALHSKALEDETASRVRMPQSYLSHVTGAIARMLTLMWSSRCLPPARISGVCAVCVCIVNEQSFPRLQNREERESERARESRFAGDTLIRKRP